jgi:hypothetical protein
MGENGTVVIALPGDPLHPEAAPAMTAVGTDELAGLPTRFIYDHGAWRPEQAER